MSRLFRAAGAISGLTLLSRVLGLWRDAVMAMVLGAGRVSDSFLLAWALPNLMRRLLGEGALSASFLPAYARARKNDGPAAASSLLASVLGTVLVILVPLVLIVTGICALLATPDAPDGDEVTGLLLPLGAILFPYTIPICLAAMLAGALNTRGSFALPAAIPVVLNVVWIATLYLAPLFGCEDDVAIAYALAWALCLGGVCQLLLVAVPLLRSGALPRPRLGVPPRGTAARAVFTAMGPTVIGMSLGQISMLVDQGMAYGLLPAGANTHLYLANRLLLFPHALTALAVAVAVFPRLATEATEVDRVRMRGTLDRAAAATLFVTVPAAVGLALLAEDIVQVLFVRQAFSAEDAALTARTTQWLVAGLPFLGLAQLYARAFYSVGDTRRPAVLAGALLLLNAALNVIFVVVFDFGTAGLAAATSIGALGNAALLTVSLRRHAPAGAGLRGAWLRALLSSIVMAVTVLLCRAATEGDDLTFWPRLLWRLALPISAGMGIYALTQWLLKSPELAAVRRRRS